MTEEIICMQWDDYERNMKLSLNRIREVLHDVTLVCDDDQQVSAHKLILCASSSVFRKLLLGINHPQPVIVLQDVNKDILVKILDFMYSGECQILNNDIELFLSTASRFKVNGLLKSPTEVDNFGKSVHHDQKEFEQNLEVGKDKLLDEDWEEIERQHPPTFFLKKGVSPQSKNKFSKPEDKFMCEHCFVFCSTKKLLGRHMQKHQGYRFECDICFKSYARKDILNNHRKKSHSLMTI